MSASAWIAIAGAIIGSGGISALGGYLLSGRNERKRDVRAAARERETLRERRADEGRVFQRDTLLEMHDLLYKLNRNAGRSQDADETRYHGTGRYGRDPLPGNLSDEFTELTTSINRLRVRIFDPELRDLVEKYTSTVIKASIHGPRRVGDDAEKLARVQGIERDILSQYVHLEPVLGASIRSQFPGSDLTSLELPQAPEG